MRTRYDIRIERKGSKFEDVSYQATSLAAAREAAEETIRYLSFTRTNLIEPITWRGHVAFVGCRPAEDAVIARYAGPQFHLHELFHPASLKSHFRSAKDRRQFQTEVGLQYKA